MNKNLLRELSEQPEMQKRASLVSLLLESINEDLEREGLIETPWRVAKMYDEIFWGYNVDAVEVLKEAIFYDENVTDLVLVKDIPVHSMCEHHIMPFFGKAHVAYIPQDGRVVGISKIARIVEIFSRRLQIQERLGKQIADTIEKVLNPRGIAVIISAEHTCMTMRGIQKPGTQTVTSCLRGSFFMDEKARNELFKLIGL